ncbi:MAG: hypothetical protein ACPGVT_08020 [Maricaulaceae bacterium]
MIYRTFAAAALLLTAAPAFADNPKAPEEAAKPFKRPALPSQAEIDDIINQMPDMNGIIGDMMGVMKDPQLLEEMKKSGDAFAKHMEDSGAFETNADGMPDFNKAFATLLGTIADEDVMGGMLDSMEDMANTLQGMEKHFPQTNASKSKEETLNTDWD